jgi:hypothetical protein
VNDWLSEFSKANAIEAYKSLWVAASLVGGGGRGGGILMRLPVKYPELVSFFISARRNLNITFQDTEDAN